MKRTEFQREIESVINRFSKENESNTPDWVLAKFLIGALESFNEAINLREGWYGRQPEELCKEEETLIKQGE